MTCYYCRYPKGLLDTGTDTLLYTNHSFCFPFKRGEPLKMQINSLNLVKVKKIDILDMLSAVHITKIMNDVIKLHSFIHNYAYWNLD